MELVPNQVEPDKWCVWFQFHPFMGERNHSTTPEM